MYKVRTYKWIHDGFGSLLCEAKRQSVRVVALLGVLLYLGANPPAGLGGGGAELLNPMGPVNISVGWVSVAKRRKLNYYHLYSNT